MSTAIDIASNALQRIGESPISSFDEGGARGQVAGNLYTSTLRAMLTMHRWRFAVTQRSLARLVDEPLDDRYSNVFQLPSDYLMAIKVDPWSDYEIYGDGKVFSNQSTLIMDYIFQPSEGRFPPWFVLLMEYKLASEFALAVTSNKGYNELYEIKYMNQLAVAQFQDSQSRTIDAIQDAPYLNVRG